MIGPTPALAPQKPRAHRTYPLEQTIGAPRVDRPITPDEICRIASKGYPLWESIGDMQLRNRRITLAYSDLSGRLASLIAREDGPRDANWCTFGTWTSKTVGTWIEDDVVPEPLRNWRRIPRLALRPLIALAGWLVQRGNGASYRCLAAGNRFVFLEIGFAIALFLERFGELDRGEMEESPWSAYSDELRDRLAELSQLDPSWLLTDAPEPADLCLGLRQYYEALFNSDPDERAELVLAGNLLIGAYEQRRVDGYVSASLALFTKRAMRNLVQHRSGVVKGWFHRWPSTLFARIMTRGLVLNTVDEQLRVAHPLPAPPGPPGTPMFVKELDAISLPLLQALLTRYDLSEGRPDRRRVRDWTSYDERMSYITNLFRSRQQNQNLFSAPFSPDIEKTLLDGRLPRRPAEGAPESDRPSTHVVARDEHRWQGTSPDELVP